MLWRDPETRRQRSQSFDDPSAAATLRNFLDANGQSFALAAEAAAAMRSTAPRVRDVVADHIDQLTGIEAGTRFRYRELRQNQSDEQLGCIPVNRLTRPKVLSWFDSLTVADKTRKNIHALLSAQVDVLADTTARRWPSRRARHEGVEEDRKGLRAHRPKGLEEPAIAEGDALRHDLLRRVYWLPAMQLLLDREDEPPFDQAPTPATHTS